MFFGLFKRLLPFMPPPKPSSDANYDDINDNNSDDNDDYKYEWAQHSDTTTINKSDNTTSTYVNTNNNNNIDAVVEVNQPTTSEFRASPPLGSTNGTFKKVKSSKYKHIKIHSVRILSV